MKTILLSLMVVFVTTLLGQSESFKVPKQWEQTFIISIAHSSSQYGDWSHLTFTHDSCTYKANRRQSINRDKSVALSQQDRDELLSRLRELKIESIKEKNRTAVLQGGWSNTLCVGERCIDGGSSSAMSVEDKEVLLTACRYLQDFARKK